MRVARGHYDAVCPEHRAMLMGIAQQLEVIGTLMGETIVLRIGPIDSRAYLRDHERDDCRPATREPLPAREADLQ